jgi:hypothetical protein
VHTFAKFSEESGSTCDLYMYIRACSLGRCWVRMLDGPVCELLEPLRLVNGARTGILAVIWHLCDIGQVLEMVTGLSYHRIKGDRGVKCQFVLSVYIAVIQLSWTGHVNPGFPPPKR